VADVRSRLLKPGGRIVPAAATLFLAPGSLGQSFCEVEFWREFKDADLSPLARHAANSAYVATVNSKQLLASAAPLFHLDAQIWESQSWDAEWNFLTERAGYIDSLIGWQVLDLGADVILATGPDDPSTHWEQCIFPLEMPRTVDRGELLHCRFTVEPFAPGSRWKWEISSRSGGWRERHEFSITYGAGTRLLKERF